MSTQIPEEGSQKWLDLVEEFRKKNISTYLPSDREYELSCATSNLLYRFTRPHFVIQPKSWEEVLAIVERTYELELHGQLTIKCGGHSYTGFSTVDQGIILDLVHMSKVHLEFEDKIPKVAVIQAGARWGDVYRKLIRTDCRGYVVNGGRCPSVGVGGFILGGGLGPFGRTLGMGSDTLVGASIITLQGGKVVKLDVDEENDPKLFWALRGGGTSAFGVVTEFRMKVCPLRNRDVDTGVSACRYVWHPDQSWKDIKYAHLEGKERDEAIKKREDAKTKQNNKLNDTMDAFYAAKWPDEMTIDSNWMLDMNESDQGKLGIRFTIYYDGPQSECKELFNKHIIDEDLRLAFRRRTLPEPSTRFLHETLFLMWEEEARLALPRTSENNYQLWCSFVFDGDADKLKQVIRISRTEQDIFESEFKNDKAGLWFTFIHSGGQVMEAGDNTTSAYPWRQGVFQCSVLLKWGEKWLERRARTALLRIKKELREHSLKFGDDCASYVNFSDATLARKGNNPHQAYYGINHQKLIDLKTERDPKNHFKWPWDTDTQKWRDLPEEEEDAPLAKILTDSIALQDWNTYELPAPPSYNELFAPPYMAYSSAPS